MRFLNTTLILGLGLGILSQSALPGWSDVFHYRNGQIVRGKINRVTGDIIEFTRSQEIPVIGRKESVQRIHLTNRRDIVETRDHQKYFGEVVYIDKFKIELHTSTGTMRINRLNVANVVLGSPMESPQSEFSHLNAPAPSADGMIPASYQPATGAKTSPSSAGSASPSPASGSDDQDLLPE